MVQIVTRDQNGFSFDSTCTNFSRFYERAENITKNVKSTVKRNRTHCAKGPLVNVFEHLCNFQIYRANVERCKFLLLLLSSILQIDRDRDRHR
jgi:hypothetical protein